LESPDEIPEYHLAPLAECPSLRPEVALWRAVIWQALCDLQRVTNASPNSYEHLRSTAKVWLLENTVSFYHVCFMADLIPSRVRQRAMEAVFSEAPVPRRAKHNRTQ
jgi:hypothetical protein